MDDKIVPFTPNEKNSGPASLKLNYMVTVSFSAGEVRTFDGCRIRCSPDNPGVFELIGRNVRGKSIVKRVLLFDDYVELQELTIIKKIKI